MGEMRNPYKILVGIAQSWFTGVDIFYCEDVDEL
jgi:hypothetical protein